MESQRRHRITQQKSQMAKLLSMGVLCAKGSRESSREDIKVAMVRLSRGLSSPYVSDCDYDCEYFSKLVEHSIPSPLLPDFTNCSPLQILDNTSNTSNSVQHARTRMEIKSMQNLQTDTGLQPLSRMKYLWGRSESIPNLHIVLEPLSVKSMPKLQPVLQPLSQMNYLQKYSPSYNVAICDHKGGEVTSEDGAIKLTVPNGAIMEGKLVMFHFITCLFCPFTLPSCHQHDLASPYYWIGISESYRFHKPIKVEFEHFAVVTACDPSHFQLLSCEDDDESFTMRPVEYALSFSVQDGISWCTFQTNHFCSYCLSHHCYHDHPIMTRIIAFFLKPKV